jgi:hypothetical protein
MVDGLFSSPLLFSENRNTICRGSCAGLALEALAKLWEFSVDIRSGGDAPMLMLARVSVFSRIAMVAAVWLCSAGAAWAGSGGGADFASPQTFVNAACMQFGISKDFCPYLPSIPTVNQLIVEDAALTGTPPADVRVVQGRPPEGAVDAGSGLGLTNPLAFITLSNHPEQAIPTDPANPKANSFLTATTTLTNGSPTTLDLTFDLPLRTMGFAGQQGMVGEIMFPLITGDANQNVSSTDLSTPQLATLRIFAAPTNTCPTCVTAGDVTWAQNMYTLDQLGMTISNDNSSPNEKFTVGIPLLVPAAFLNTGLLGSPAYNFSAGGHPFASGLFDGIDPVANFLDATNFLDNNNDQLAFRGDLAIVKDGSTIISDPVPTPASMPEPSTLVLLGSGLLGLVLSRRRRSAGRVEPKL